MALDSHTASDRGAAALFEAWNPAGSGTVHQRLAAALLVLGPAANLDDDTLGQRNRRLLELCRSLEGSPLEARVKCERCGVESEFDVPADLILALPAPGPDTTVTVGSGRRLRAFRLPRMADLEAAADATGAAEVRRVVLERCLVRGHRGEVPELVAHRLAARFDALDPAANVVVHLKCSGCGEPLSATVDMADFVARALDREVEGLLREIDTVAAAYGWAEDRILALPAWRRRHYVELIRSSRTPVGMSLAPRAG